MALESHWDSCWELSVLISVPQARDSTCCPCHMSLLGISSALLQQLVAAEGGDRSGGEGIIAANNESGPPAMLCLSQTCALWRDQSLLSSPRAQTTSGSQGPGAWLVLPLSASITGVCSPKINKNNKSLPSIQPYLRENSLHPLTCSF